ncbi:MAG: gamma-glutamyltransferase [Gemmatimonadetes bacterium]|nr:gamma-glutamyltransferase [Gemmatimonadota bacterium]
MMLRILGLLTLAIQTPDSTIILDGGVRGPAFSATGRLAFELNGDLWVADLPRDMTSKPMISASGVQRVTDGPAWDRDPAWTPDGMALVFSSDRSGTFDIWRVAVGARGPTGVVERLTQVSEPEGEPAVGPDGAIVFVRGRNAEANIWLIADDGALRQITTADGGEFSPAFSPSGDSIAYVSRQDRNNRLQIRALNADEPTTVLQSVAVEHPAWSPQGDRIAYSTRGGRAGVWVTPLDGSYSNLVSEESGESAWTPDGLHLAIAELPAGALGYNGDPDRLGDRNVGDLFPSDGKFWIASVPAVPQAGLTEIALAVSADREAYNTQAFDRVWTRLQSLYYAKHAGGEWSRLRDRYRPRASRAGTEEELEDVIYQMLRERPPLRAEASGRAGVSSAHSLATAAGVEILDAGGNVVDAAVAVSFALGVVEPDASGVAGYGEMLVYLEDMDAPVVIEFLTRVPEQASLGNSSLPAGELPRDGPVVANVPGTVAGMHKAWELYGSGDVEWARLVEPAIRLAEEGFPLDDGFTTTLALERERFLKYQSSRALFFPDGEPLQAGDTLKNPDLAWTLQQIADGGADAFYKGEIARRMVEDLRGQGNAMTLHDLSRYYAAVREPIQGTYRDHTVYSSAPAASGGTSLVAKLNLLERFRNPDRYTDHTGTLHAMIEAWKLQPSSRGKIADPGLWPVDVTSVLSKDSARVRWERCFDPQQSTTPEELTPSGTGAPACAEEVTSAVLEEGSGCLVDFDDRDCRATGTTAFAVADANGNMVSVTQTLGTWGGNFYVSPGLGFLYNDKLNSYSSDPSSYNARLPYARNRTSIAPTLIFRGTEDDRRPRAAVGAAGNAWITSAVYQMVAAMIDADLGPQEALELPRFLVGGRRQPGANGARNVVIQIEDGISPVVLRELEAMGHVFQRISLRGELRMGYGAVVLIDGNRVRAGGDPRRAGAGGAIQ